MMRKSVFLTLLIALFSVATAWAEFNPTPGVKYALQERTSGLYLDIQTLGITAPGLNTNNISLNSAPCAIYFEAYSWEDAWAMKNINGGYVYIDYNYSWNPQIGETGRDWLFTENSDGYVTIGVWGPNIVGNTTEGTPLYCNAQDTPLQFSLVEFVEQTQEYTFHINAPQEVSVTYNGKPITDGGAITVTGSPNKTLFAAEDIKGYAWTIEVDEANKIVTLVYNEVVEGDDELKGYYYISFMNGEVEVPLFIGYNTENDDWVGDDHMGYKILGKGVYTNEAEADKVFTIVPQGEGFVVSAQGKYLKAIDFNTWNHIQFADEKSAAGVYLFHETDLAGAFKIQGTGMNDGVGEHNNFLQVYNTNGKLIVGPNPETVAHSFKITPATTYPVDKGLTTLYLPFNVVLPEGVVAYDIVNAAEETLESGENLLTEIAVAGDILLAGTPVVLDVKAATSLTITTNSSGAKGAAQGSLLRGSFVKHTLGVGTSKNYILHDRKFEQVTVTTEMPANSCWVVTTMEDENAKVEDGHIIIDGWEFTYTDELKNNRITLVNCVKEGDPDLTIGSKYFVKGVEKEVVAISPTFLHGNTTLESVTIPATMTNLGFRVIEPMFEGSYEGQEGDFATYVEGKTPPEVLDSAGMHRCFVFPEDKDTGKPYVVGKDFAWKLTLDVTIDVPEGGEHPSFNPWGSAVVSTKPNSLDDNYQGYMQIYLWKDLQHIVVKIDNADDRYASSIPDETGNLYVNKNFTFELEHDGAGGYQAVVYFGNGKAKMFNITATKDNMVGDFDRLYYSLPEGIHVNVKFEKLLTQGLFVGCTNLEEIKVDPANPTFKSCEHGVLYDKNGFYVMRIPEAGGHVEEDGRRHFNIPSKVVKFYQGAVHGVDADIVLHSNPQIVVVDGHPAPAKFYLSLDDIDNTIENGETGYGGARNFTSANANHYQSARYKRAPLKNKDIYGTFMLPFAPTNALDKYEFFELKAASGDCLTFTQVTELKAKTPYIYRLKEGVEPGDDEVMTMENGLDVFETTDTFTVELLAKFAHDGETELVPLGAYVNGYVETKNYPNSNYYSFSVSRQEFNRITKKLTYRPYRAFFVWNNPNQGQAAPAKLSMRVVTNEGETTEITPEQIEGWEESVYYDLQGRRVLNPTNGIYIVNGRKVVIE